MRKKIQEYLLNLEGQENIWILYACESGSRSWGFPSKDSDYDVRFIYVRNPVENYLSLNIENRRDVIERKEVDNLDFDGWDLRKALKLLKKCNPPLFEWFEASGKNIYWKDKEFYTLMKETMPRYYNYPAMCYHYMHMANGNYRDYLLGDEVWVKKYFYVLRPMLGVMYLMEFNKIPPLNFRALVSAMVHPGAVKDAIEELVTMKLKGNELARGPKIPEISDYITQNMSGLEHIRFLPTGKYEKTWDPLNEIFLTMLNKYK